MYEIKVEESETLCPKCGKLLSAVRVRQSGAIPSNIFEAIQSNYRAKYPSLSVDAAGWLLAEECPANHTAPPISQHQPTSPETDRSALIALYHVTDGSNWIENDNWLSDAPIGEWFGVLTDRNGRVIQLHLARNGLNGEILHELGKLVSLTLLDLSSNWLSGGIPPELGSLSNLQHLDLSNNLLNGEIPRELGDLTRLTWLDIGGNSLDGKVPRELSNLSDLKTLSLSRNSLSGDIPQELGSLVTLTYLSLSENWLGGEIPWTLGNLSNLWYLRLERNQLTGTIPAEIYYLLNLKQLDLRGNRLDEQALVRLQRWIALASAVGLSLKDFGVDSNYDVEFNLGLFFDDSRHDRNARRPFDATFSQLLMEQMEGLLSKLTDLESLVLRLRFGLGDGRSRTLEEIGREFGFTREKIRGIEDIALRKFRRLTGSPEFDPISPRSGDLFEDELDDFFDEDCNGCSNESGVSI